MARITLLPREAQAPIGTREQTAAEWLAREMECRHLSGMELFRGMQRAGFTGRSPNIVSLWRTGASAISLRTLPLVLAALGMTNREKRLWVRHFTCADYPELQPFLEEAA